MRRRGKGIVMRKWFVMVFGLFGYAIGVFYYVGAYFRLTPELVDKAVWYSCLGCVRVGTPYADRWKVGVFLVGPLNALIYAIVGFLIGAVVLRLRRASN